MTRYPPLDTHAIFTRYGLKEIDVARVLGISRVAIIGWRHGTRRPAPQTAIRAEELLNIPKHELRPDLWPPPQKAARTTKS